ncbi:MAG: helix-turn-helix domain-containing protein [Pseudomonadota bacterium]
MNDINLLYVAIDGAACLLTLLLAARLVSQSPDYRVAGLFVLLALGALAYFISSRHDYGVLIAEPYRLDLGGWHALFNIARNGSAGAFMLLCHLVFRDETRLPRVLSYLFVLQILLEEPLEVLFAGSVGEGVAHTLLFEALPSLLQTCFLGMAFYWMIASSAGDLVIPRRRARVLVASIYSVQGLLSLIFERVAFGLQWISYDWQYPIHVALVGFGVPLSAVILFASFSPNLRLVLGATRPRPPIEAGAAAQNDAQARDARSVRAALEEEQIYRQPGLSVRDLAQHLVVPEYRLRQVIHEELGFRNFSALLHHYRVGEVAKGLQDAAQNRTPVLTLALSAGYQSINPFNRAFRELHGMTPTEYRRRTQTMVDSCNTPSQNTIGEVD